VVGRHLAVGSPADAWRLTGEQKQVGPSSWLPSDGRLTAFFSVDSRTIRKTGELGRTMTVNNTELGLCPHCEQPVSEGELLIDYESKRGERIVVATCPDCVAVVTLV